MQPDMLYVGEKPLDPQIVEVWPDAERSSFTLFEDDGVSFDYEKGEYCETEYQAQKAGDGAAITIGARQCAGQYAPQARNYLFRVRSDMDPGSVYLGGTELEKKASESALHSSQSGWFYTDRTVLVRFPDTGERMLLGIREPVAVQRLKTAGVPAVTRTMVGMSKGLSINLKEFGNHIKQVSVYDYNGSLVYQTVTKNRNLTVPGTAGSVYIVRVKILD